MLSCNNKDNERDLITNASSLAQVNRHGKAAKTYDNQGKQGPRFSTHLSYHCGSVPFILLTLFYQFSLVLVLVQVPIHFHYQPGLKLD